jgi:hypothetical protein
MAHVVRVSFDELPKTPGLEKLALIVSQMNNHRCPAFAAIRGCHRERIPAVRHPHMACLPGARRARHDVHALGDKEGTVETDAELTNEACVRLALLGEALEERSRAGVRDRPQGLDEFLLRHADARVFDRERTTLRVWQDANDHGRIPLRELRIRQRSKSEPIEGIGRVRDELSQKDVRVGVERMDDEVQDLGNVGLE